MNPDRIRELLMVNQQMHAVDLEFRPVQPSRWLDTDKDDQIAALIADVQYLREEVGDLEYRNRHLRDAVLKAEECNKHLTAEMNKTLQDSIRGSEQSMKGMLLLALHLAEVEAKARTLAEQAELTLAQTRAYISDAPEPATMQMLDDLEAAVKVFTAKPSDEVLKLLDEHVGPTIGGVRTAPTANTTSKPRTKPSKKGVT